MKKYDVVIVGFGPTGDSHWAVEIFLTQEGKGFSGQKIWFVESHS